MEKNELKSIIVDQNKKYYEEEFIQRDVLKNINEYSTTNFIIILVGLRRVGKSTILNEIKNYSKSEGNYLNFDDFRLIKFELEDFQKLQEIFLELYNEKKEFYFDEIQNMKYWERFIRTLHDNKKKIYITGSNALMLSSELGTHLTGRNIPIHIYPFSFKEFLLFKKVVLDEKSLYETSKKVQIIKLFNEYLKVGGIPEYIKTGKQDYLKFIYEDIINRDIVNRYSITNMKSLKDLLHYMITNIGKEFSYNKLKDIIGVKNPTTVKEYIQYYENSFLIFTINKFEYSLKKQIVNPKKVYCIDNGIANTISFKFSEDRGRLLENLVFVELKRRDKKIFYHREKKECDFLIKEKEKITQAIQVTLSLNDEKTRKREVDGLIEAMNIHELDEGLIITEDEESEEIIDGKKIVIKPIWKWLLSET